MSLTGGPTCMSKAIEYDLPTARNEDFLATYVHCATIEQLHKGWCWTPHVKLLQPAATSGSLVICLHGSSRESQESDKEPPTEVTCPGTTPFFQVLCHLSS